MMRLLLAAVLGATVAACTSSSSNLSGNSGVSTNNSSANSNNSTAGSSNSSQGTSNSSKGSSDSNASSKASSDNTTADTGLQRTSVILAGSTLLTTAGIGLGLTIYWLKNDLLGPKEATPPEVQARQAQAWLNANLKQLKQDLALGAGPTVRDLASAAEIRPEHLGRFGKLLQTHRAEVLAPATAGARVSLEQATQVLMKIGELTRNDEVLQEDAAAFRLRHPEPG